MDKKEKIIINYDEYTTSIPDTEKEKLNKYEKENIKEIKAVIPGVILKVNVKKGSEVKKGDILFILEAMKMRNRIYAEFDGTIKEVSIKEGDRVAKGTLLLSFE